MIPSEEDQAGVFDDQEVVNLVSPQGAIGWKRSRTASERTYLVPLGGAKRDDLGTLQGILDESDGPKSIRPSVSDPQLDMSDSRTFGLDPCHLPTASPDKTTHTCLSGFFQRAYPRSALTLLINRFGRIEHVMHYPKRATI